MIPLLLKLSGIYSYRTEQVIDFRLLTAGHLFGIFGAVGSGKSALLEAIVFALYGESERLNSRELRSYNMMNLKSNEAFIQFDFLAPANKGHFRAVAKGKRNSRNKEDVKFDRALYHVENEQLTPLDPGAVESIIGISYTNFRRTIIIPQGKFQEFLQLGSKDRTEMVKELFNLQKFDLSFRTGRLQKKNDEALNTCQGRLQQLGEVSQEDITLKQQELQLLLTDIEAGESRLHGKELLEKEQQFLSENESALHKNREMLQVLQARLPEMNQIKQLLTDFDECVANFKSDFDLLEDKQKLGISEDALLLQRKEELERAAIAQTELEARFDVARIAYEKRDLLQLEAKELGICARLNKLAKEAEVLKERIANGEAQVNSTARDMESHKAQVVFTRNNFDTLKARLPELDRLKNASEWFSRLSSLIEKRDTQISLENSDKENLSALRNELGSLLINAGLEETLDESGMSEVREQLSARKDQVEKELGETTARLSFLEVQEHLKKYAGSLEEGKPCPLCGSVDHPHVVELEDFEDELLQKNALKADLENRLTKVREAASKSDILLRSIAKEEAELKKVQALLIGMNTEIDEHRKQNPWPGINQEQLKEQWELFHRIQQELDNLDKQIQDAQSRANAEAENLNKYSALLEKLKLEENTARQNSSNLRAMLTLVNPDEYANTTVEVIEEKAVRLSEQYRSCEETYRSLENLTRVSKEGLQKLAGVIQKSEESQKALQESILELTKQLEARILSSRFGSESRIREILSVRIDRAKEMERLQTFSEQLVSVTSAIQQIENQLKGKRYDKEAHDLLIVDIRNLKALLDQKKERKGGLEKAILDIRKDLEEAEKIKTELKALEIRRDNLKTLADLFRAQGFVNFVSTMYLQNLVNLANERFYKLTRQQLKLELDEENNFRIRDYLNEGQWRNVKTLSGGQTFQASLCLALALADNIQQLNQGGQNFFFLDEGFGTLDRESLEQVFDTLKSLRKENRIVGVISHVEDLQQEIGAWLRVTRDEESGSRITPSW